MNEAEHEQIQDDSHVVVTDIPGLEKDAEGKASSFPRLYATFDGKVVVSTQPDSMAGDNMKNEYLVKLHITWDDIEWHVTVPRGYTPHVILPSDNTTMFSIGDPACASALDDIVSLGGYYSAT